MLRSRAANIWRGFLSMHDAAALSHRSANWIETTTTTTHREQADVSRTSLWSRWYSSGERIAKHTHNRSAGHGHNKRVARRKMNEEIASSTVRLVSDTGALEIASNSLEFDEHIHEYIYPISMYVCKIESAAGSEIIATSAALQRAREANRDLVEVASHAQPPTVKIVDLAQERAELFAREKQKREKELQRRRFEALKEVCELICLCLCFFRACCCCPASIGIAFFPLKRQPHSISWMNQHGMLQAFPTDSAQGGIR